MIRRASNCAWSKAVSAPACGAALPQVYSLSRRARSHRALDMIYIILSDAVSKVNSLNKSTKRANSAADPPGARGTAAPDLRTRKAGQAGRPHVECITALRPSGRFRSDVGHDRVLRAFHMHMSRRVCARFTQAFRNVRAYIYAASACLHHISRSPRPSLYFRAVHPGGRALTVKHTSSTTAFEFATTTGDSEERVGQSQPIALYK